MGFSSPGPLPRDTASIVEDPHAALQTPDFPGPYILVGHSLGGMDMRLYASRYPNEVVGMVLVDPANPYQDKRFAAVSPTVAAVTQGEITATRRCADFARAGTLKPGGEGWAACGGDPPAEWPDALRAHIIALRADPAAAEQRLSEIESVAEPGLRPGRVGQDQPRGHSAHRADRRGHLEGSLDPGRRPGRCGQAVVMDA